LNKTVWTDTEVRTRIEVDHTRVEKKCGRLRTETKQLNNHLNVIDLTWLELTEAECHSCTA